MYKKIFMYKLNIKKILKLSIMTILNILIDIYNILPKKRFNISNIDKVYIVSLNLGIGDLIMLSPIIKLIAENFIDKKIFLITDHNKLFNIDNLIWLKPVGMDDLIIDKKKSLVISLTLSWYHIKYIIKTDFYIGYFFTNKLVSNFIKNNIYYQPKLEHYINRTFVILDSLSIKYNKDNFFYPKLLRNNNWVDIKVSSNLYNMANNDYVVVAPYSNWSERQYPSDKFIKILLKLSVYYKIVLIGSNNKDEVNLNKDIYQVLLDVSHETKEVVNLTGKTSIHQVIDIISNAIAYIGNDSGTSNIAFITASKSIVFFGSVLPNTRIPLNQNLKSNIKTYHREDLCDIYPCYDGFNKPMCQYNYKCLNFDIEINDIIKFIKKDTK